MKEFPRVKNLCFINDPSLIESILFQDFISISSLTSEHSSMLNFSTFRSEDFADFGIEDSPPSKILTLHKSSTKASASANMKKLNFINHKDVIRKILLTDNIEDKEKNSKMKKPLKMSFQVSRAKVQQILAK